jgi:PAS domain-containing protein
MYQLRMAAVFQSVNEGLMIFDEKMRLVEINDAANKMLCCERPLVGLTPGEISAFCPPLKTLQGLIEERCEGEIFRVEVELKDGPLAAFGVTMAPLTGHDLRELGTVLVLRDETQPARQV